MSHLEKELEQTLEEAKYFTLRGCKMEGVTVISKTAETAISNWAGSCTDPNDVDTYQNPEAMFEALDLIYKVIEFEVRGSSESETK